MMTFRISIVFAAAIASCVAGAAAKDCVGDKDAAAAENEIVELHAAWAEARKARDVAFLESFYDPELILNVSNGQRVTRERDISLFRDGVIRAQKIENGEIEVRLFCDAALATGIEHVKGTYGGQPGDMSLRFVNVLERRTGAWRLVAHQSTPIAAAAAGKP